MDKRFFKVLILVLAFSSSIVVRPVFAQSIPKPSLPEFSVKYFIYSSYVPPTYGIDQYTGKNVTIQNGYQVTNRTLVFTIKNQLFTPYTDANGNNMGFTTISGTKDTLETHGAITPSLMPTAKTQPCRNKLPIHTDH